MPGGELDGRDLRELRRWAGSSVLHVEQPRQGTFWVKVGWGEPYTPEFFTLELSTP